MCLEVAAERTANPSAYEHRVPAGLCGIFPIRHEQTQAEGVRAMMSDNDELREPRGLGQQNFGDRLEIVRLYGFISCD
jgi:hypothetical protein